MKEVISKINFGETKTIEDEDQRAQKNCINRGTRREKRSKNT